MAQVKDALKQEGFGILTEIDLQAAFREKLGRDFRPYVILGKPRNIVFHIERGDPLDILEHPHLERYAGQRIFVVEREDYVYLVPFPPSPAGPTRGLRRGHAVALRAEADVEGKRTLFLKTIIPSRKATKQYLGEEPDDEDRR